MKSFLWFLCWGIFSLCLHLEPQSRRCLLALDFVLRYQLCSSAQSGFVSHLQIYISEHSHMVCAPQEPTPPLKVPAHGSIDQLYFFLRLLCVLWCSCAVSYIEVLIWDTKCFGHRYGCRANDSITRNAEKMGWPSADSLQICPFTGPQKTALKCTALWKIMENNWKIAQLSIALQICFACLNCNKYVVPSHHSLAVASGNSGNWLSASTTG